MMNVNKTGVESELFGKMGGMEAILKILGKEDSEDENE